MQRDVPKVPLTEADISCSLIPCRTFATSNVFDGF